MTYDTIVVGAGSAGAIVAARLTEDSDRQVLLLEAGPDYPDDGELPDELKYGQATGTDVTVSNHNWGFVARATSEATEMPVPRGRVTGGTSAINGQIFLRGVPEDFDSWAMSGNPRWSFDETLPFFRKLEDDADFKDEFHGNGGPIPVRRFTSEEWLPAQKAFFRACIAHGYSPSPDLNHPRSSGVGPYPFNNQGGIRYSTALTYLKAARSRPNLTIEPDTFVRRIVFDRTRATGVVIEQKGGRRIVEGAQIVLSAGAIGTPHLMLLSGVGPSAELNQLGISVVADRPGVGKNLRDHPGVAVTWRSHPDVVMDASAPRYQLGLRYTSQGSTARNDMKISMVSFATDSADKGGSRMVSVGVRMLPTIQLALGAGELRLASTDSLVQPILDYRYLEDDGDLRRLREAVRLCVVLAKDAAFSDVAAELREPTEDVLASDRALDAWLRQAVTTSHHIAGTCKMGPDSDPMAVADQFGNVYGVSNLRIADASLMPDCVRANINATTMMIGERIADFIRHG